MASIENSLPHTSVLEDAAWKKTKIIWLNLLMFINYRQILTNIDTYLIITQLI